MLINQALMHFRFELAYDQVLRQTPSIHTAISGTNQP
jgi:hypothetical protein